MLVLVGGVCGREEGVQKGSRFLLAAAAAAAALLVFMRDSELDGLVWNGGRRVLPPLCCGTVRKFVSRVFVPEGPTGGGEGEVGGVDVQCVTRIGIAGAA